MLLMQDFKILPTVIVTALQFLIKTKWIALTGLVVITISTIVWLKKHQPVLFLQKTRVFFLYSLNMPPGASLERTKKVVEKVDSIIATVEAVEKSYSVAGMNIITNATSPISALAFVKLKKPDQGKDRRHQ